MHTYFTCACMQKSLPSANARRHGHRHRHRNRTIAHARATFICIGWIPPRSSNWYLYHMCTCAGVLTVLCACRGVFFRRHTRLLLMAGLLFLWLLSAAAAVALHGFSGPWPKSSLVGGGGPAAAASDGSGGDGSHYPETIRKQQHTATSRSKSSIVRLAIVSQGHVQYRAAPFFSRLTRMRAIFFLCETPAKNQGFKQRICGRWCHALAPAWLISARWFCVRITIYCLSNHGAYLRAHHAERATHRQSLVLACLLYHQCLCRLQRTQPSNHQATMHEAVHWSRHP